MPPASSSHPCQSRVLHVGAVHVDTPSCLHTVIPCETHCQNLTGEDISGEAKYEQSRGSSWESCSLEPLCLIVITVIKKKKKLHLTCPNCRGCHTQATSYPLLRSLPQIAPF